MLSRTISWIKSNKLASVLALILIYLFIKNSPKNRLSSGISYPTADYSMGSAKSIAPLVSREAVAPQMDITERKVITNSYISIQVKNVTQTIKDIQDKVSDLRGYVVNKNIQRPEQGEDGTMVVRVPTAVLDEMLTFVRQKGIKVVSENISGTDITDQYVDIQTRLERLEKTKRKFEDILDRAQSVDDILRVQNEILNIQGQIDSYKGQLKYMEGSSETSLITINLSTDELSLPYTPVKSWRPSLIFKEAVRSLLVTFQKIGTLAIWVVVFTPIIVPTYFIYRYIKNKRKIRV